MEERLEALENKFENLLERHEKLTLYVETLVLCARDTGNTNVFNVNERLVFCEAVRNGAI